MSAPGAHGSSILVVEDDSDLSYVIALTLQDEGYTVECAANGREALEILRRAGPGAAPAVILLDLMMPIMNGREFRAAQLADPVLAGIPVVLLSGDGNVQQKSAALKVDVYLLKPIDLDILLTTVANYCSPPSR